MLRAAVIPPAGTPVGWRPLQFCSRETPWLTQFKAFGVYIIPRAEVQVSGTFRSIPDDALRAVFNASNAYLAANSTLGRPLAGGVANLAIDLVAPYSVYLLRRNELNMRFGRVLRTGRSKYVVSLDVYNALNIDTVVNANQNFSVWQRPTAILNARQVKFSVQFDYGFISRGRAETRLAPSADAIRAPRRLLRSCDLCINELIPSPVRRRASVC